MMRRSNKKGVCVCFKENLILLEKYTELVSDLDFPYIG